MMTQTEIADYFKAKYGTRISQDRVSRMLKGEEKVSWPFAGDLSQEFPPTEEKDFPGGTVLQWKNATPDELRIAFEQLKPEEAAA